jgi:type II secretory pathway pseudopilin PulG
MGSKTETGFTLIETMLFLGVTGMLAVGILVGSSVAIGQQRYRDSVNSLKSYIQQQYGETSNVINDHGQNWDCNTSGVVSDVGGTSGQARGASDCVVLGRFIKLDADGTSLTSSSVTGYRVPGVPTAASDIQEIATNYRLGVSPLNSNESEVAWSARIVKEKTTTPLPFQMLIIRSPLSGSLLTFTTENNSTDLGAMVTASNQQQIRHLCVDAAAGTFVGKRLEVRIDAFAASQSAVAIPPEQESVCD